MEQMSQWDPKWVMAAPARARTLQLGRTLVAMAPAKARMFVAGESALKP
jgi:hypothetical protein